MRGQQTFQIAALLQEVKAFGTQLDRAVQDRLREVAALGLLNEDPMRAVWVQHEKVVVLN